jgi:hypothetical protein
MAIKFKPGLYLIGGGPGEGKSRLIACITKFGVVVDRDDTRPGTKLKILNMFANEPGARMASLPEQLYITKRLIADRINPSASALDKENKLALTSLLDDIVHSMHLDSVSGALGVDEAKRQFADSRAQRRLQYAAGYFPSGKVRDIEDYDVLTIDSLTFLLSYSPPGFGATKPGGYESGANFLAMALHNLAFVQGVVVFAAINSAVIPYIKQMEQAVGGVLSVTNEGKSLRATVRPSRTSVSMPTHELFGLASEADCFGPQTGAKTEPANDSSGVGASLGTLPSSSKTNA